MQNLEVREHLAPQEEKGAPRSQPPSPPRCPGPPSFPCWGSACIAGWLDLRRYRLLVPAWSGWGGMGSGMPLPAGPPACCYLGALGCPANLVMPASSGVPGCPQHPSAVSFLPAAQLGRLEHEFSLPGAGLPGLAGWSWSAPAGWWPTWPPGASPLGVSLSDMPAHCRARQGIGLGSPGRAPSSPAPSPPSRAALLALPVLQGSWWPSRGPPREAPGFLAPQQLCGGLCVCRSFCWGSTGAGVPGSSCSLPPGRTLGSAA